MTATSSLSIDSLVNSVLADQSLVIPAPPTLWKSGVYAVVDCVFSAQSRYETMVLPMLRERLSARAGMGDDAQLRFSDFMADVHSVPRRAEEGPWDAYGKEVLNLQVLAGRRKVEVCHEVAGFFRDRNLETMADLRALGEGELIELIHGPLRKSIKGIGPALARYLAVLLDVRDELRPDVHVLHYIAKLSAWQPRSKNQEDLAAVCQVIRRVAKGLGISATRLEIGMANWQSVE